jgi:predicted MFS family arabinose efflux permease
VSGVQVRPGRLVAAGTALIATCYGLARFTYGLFSPDFAAEFELSPLVSGMLGSGSYVGYCVAILIATTLTPRWGARWVGVLAGATATVGIVTVAVASSAAMLAIGLLVAGSSTGIASPPMAAAIARWISDARTDQAQTLVNAGTGVGVLVSGPIALALLAHWRVAWAIFALVSALVTVAVWRFVPPGRPPEHTRAPRPGGVGGRPAGTLRLLVCSGLMGMGSIAVWTLGRQAIIDQGGTPLLATLVWTIIGAAGITGALAGPAVNRFGLGRSWVIGMTAMAAASLTLSLFAAQPLAAATAAAAFGAAYIALTGIVLVWATRLFPDRASFGVGIAFLLIAAGQAVGSPLVGASDEPLTLPGVFIACAALTSIGALLAPRGQ